MLTELKKSLNNILNELTDILVEMEVNWCEEVTSPEVAEEVLQWLRLMSGLFEENDTIKQLRRVVCQLTEEKDRLAQPVRQTDYLDIDLALESYDDWKLGVPASAFLEASSCATADGVAVPSQCLATPAKVAPDANQLSPAGPPTAKPEVDKKRRADGSETAPCGDSSAADHVPNIEAQGSTVGQSHPEYSDEKTVPPVIKKRPSEGHGFPTHHFKRSEDITASDPGTLRQHHSADTNGEYSVELEGKEPSAPDRVPNIEAQDSTVEQPHAEYSDGNTVPPVMRKRPSEGHGFPSHRFKRSEDTTALDPGPLRRHCSVDSYGENSVEREAVSYTHLTLPTIYSV